MRNAAATFDDDLGFDAPRRKSAPRKPAGKAQGKSAGRKKKAGRGLFDMHRVARYAAIGMGATMAIGIMVNALMMQRGHHPAPLFGKAIADTPTAVATPAPVKTARTMPAAERVEAPTPAPAKAGRTAAARDTAARDTAARDTAARDTAARDTASTSADDPIAKLLRGGGAPAAAEKGESKTVMGVQRALTKLGFKVPATGAAGPATKKAIEAFEKDRHLPVKGDMSRRLVKVLSAESGVKID